MAKEGEVGWLLPISVDQHSNHGLRTNTTSSELLLFNLGSWVFENQRSMLNQSTNHLFITLLYTCPFQGSCCCFGFVVVGSR
jgi:hypothetical protein